MVFLQMIKGMFTLRHGFKRGKKPPRIVYRYGNQDKQIARFLANRRFILNFLNDGDKKYPGFLGSENSND